MRHLVLLSLVCALALQMLVPAPVHAADDSSASVEGLDEVENAYVGRMRGAYGAALAALDKLSGDIGGAAFGALFGAGTPSPTEMLNMVLACRAALAATVPAFKEAPRLRWTALAQRTPRLRRGSRVRSRR